MEPADILSAWPSRRAELLQRHIDLVRKADADEAVAYMVEIRANRQAVAAGLTRPVEQRQLTGN
ncbi:MULTISPECIES: hypothetical protein [Streptomyces]|uniref:hypothetical protein n=1 Tax=Streptomyces TaxID=1883 RepID=UPI000F4E1B30|nr:MULTISPECIES: hypothetical protein [Streptomyces]